MVGVSAVITTSMVGSLRQDVQPETLVIPDQLVEWSSGPTKTAYSIDQFGFADCTEPYCDHLRTSVIKSSRNWGLPLEESGVYFSVAGPRYETAAEVRMFRMLGGTIVGMTNGPECLIARELGLCYSTICLVTNYGAGLAPNVTIEHVANAASFHGQVLSSVIMDAVDSISMDRTCSCRQLPTMFGRQALPNS